MPKSKKEAKKMKKTKKNIQIKEKTSKIKKVDKKSFDINELKKSKNPLERIKTYIESMPIEKRAETLFEIGKKIANVTISTQDYKSDIRKSKDSNLELGLKIMKLALIFPGYPDDLIELMGLIYTNNNDPNNALEVYTKAFERKPIKPMIITGILNVALPLGRQDIVDRCIKISLEDDAILKNPYSLSNVLYALNRKETKKDSKIALKLTKDYLSLKDKEMIPSLYINMIDVYIVADEIDETLDALIRGILQEPSAYYEKYLSKEPIFYENVAWYYLKKGDINDTIFYLKEARKNNHPAFKALKDSKYFSKLKDNPDFQNLFKKGWKPSLYEGKDGFIIEERWGDVDYFGDILKTIIRKYGLSENPDLNMMLKIMNIVLPHIISSRFDDAIGYPVYPNSDYNSALIWIARNIIEIITKELEPGETYQNLLDKALSDLYDEEERWEWDMKTR